MSAAENSASLRVAIMQPYFFPYAAYFQLIHAVDTFVVYDDVNYIKGGWINRNRILGIEGGSELITLRTVGASPNKLINQIHVGNNRLKVLKTIQQRYAKAPQFESVYSIISQILTIEEGNLTRFLFRQLKLICAYLGIAPDWKLSSDIAKDNTLKGQDKVIAICEILGASDYINAIGGKSLYRQALFDQHGISLSFIKSNISAYRQFADGFVADLSIVDMLMFNDRETCKSLLREYSIVH